MKKNGKNKIKRTVGVISLCIAVLTSSAAFTGCGGGKEKNNSSAVVNQQEALKTLSFKVDSLNVSSSLSGNIISKNDLLYSVAYSYTVKDDVYLNRNDIIVFDRTGIIRTVIPVTETTKENEYSYIMGDLYVDDGGNISCMRINGSYDNESGESEEKNELVTFSGSGELVSSIDLGDVVTNEDNEAGRYFQNYLMDSQGNIYINLCTCIRVLDKAGNVLFTTKELSDNENGNVWLNKVFMTNEGVPAVYLNDYSGDEAVYKIIEVDAEAKNWGKEYIMSTYANVVYTGSGDYLCYVDSDTGIAGVRADTLERENVLNLLNLGIDNSNINCFSICGDGSFVVSEWNYSGNGSSLNIDFITPDDNPELKEKKVITLGCFDTPWSIRSSIAEFNRTNDEYTIYCTSYIENNDISDYEAAITKFNNEILAGNVPDLLVVDSSMPYDSYAAKGLFADLYGLMENDPEISRDSFLPNILQAMEKDGKLYSVTDSFNLCAYAAKKSLTGDVSSITFDEANDIVASMPEGAQLFSDMMTRSGVVQNAVERSGLVNYRTASCNFDSDEFKTILENAKEYPAEIDYEALYNNNPNYWQEEQTACRDNKALICSCYIYSFEEYNRLKNVYIGDDVAFVGFPAASHTDSQGGTLNLGTLYAVSDKSEYKEGAWTFIKSLLTNVLSVSPVYRYDSSDIYGEEFTVGMSISADSEETSSDEVWYEMQYSSGFPVLKEPYEKLALQATQPRYYYDENGNKVEQDNTFYTGTEEIKMPVMTQAEVDEFSRFIQSVTDVYTYDENIQKIISEETELFFNGTKSVDETASVIQSRISIYLSEQY